MDPHRVEVLNGADDHHIVGGVAHHLQLVLLPADDRLIHQDFVGGRGIDAGQGHPLVLLKVVGDTTAGATEGKRRSNNGRKTDLFDDLQRLFPVMGQAGAGHLKTDLFHGLLEQGAILGLLDGRQLGADQLHTESVQHPHLGHCHRRIEGGLAAQGRQHCIGPFFFNDLGQYLRRDRFDVGAVGKVRVGHDGGRVAV